MPDTLEAIQNWLQNTGFSALEFLVRAAIAILIYFIVYKVTKKFCKWLSKRLDHYHLEHSMNTFLVSIIKYGILLFTIVTIIIQLNIVAASSIAALIASAGVAVSLALQGGLSNFVGGIMLLLLKPFKAGDYILVNSTGLEGTVERIEMYYTTIVGLDNQVHMIPNSSLTGNAITNATHMEKRRIIKTIGISYNADLKKAKEILRNIFMEEPLVIDKEKMQIYVAELGDSAVTLGYRVWIRGADYWDAIWSLNEKIKLSFDEAGIEIPYNQLDVHIRNENTTERTKNEIN